MESIQVTNQPVTIKSLRGELIRCQKNSLYDEASQMFEKLKAFESEQLRLQQTTQPQQPQQQKHQKHQMLDANCWNMMISLCEGNLDLTYVFWV